MWTKSCLFLCLIKVSVSIEFVMVVTSTDEFEDPKVLEVYNFGNREWRSVSKSNEPSHLSPSYRAESLKPGTARVVEDHAVLEYELVNGLSLELARYSDSVEGSATLEYGDTLCIVGGYDLEKKRLRKEVLCWNPLNEQILKTSNESSSISESSELSNGLWVTLPPMSQGRHEPGTVVMDGKLYVAGGYDTEQHTFLASMEVFDDVTQKWYSTSPMSHPRAGLKLVSNAGQLYAIGGWMGHKYLSVVEKYDPFSDQWINVPDINVGRAHFGAVASNGSIYVVGGSQGFLPSHQLKSLEVYNGLDWSMIDYPEMEIISGPVSATLVKDV